MLAGSADEAVQPSRKPGPRSLPAITSLQYELHVRQGTLSSFICEQQLPSESL